MTTAAAGQHDTPRSALRAPQVMLVLAALLAFDIAWILLTRASLASPTTVVGGLGFGVRLVLLTVCLGARHWLTPRSGRGSGTARGALLIALCASLGQFHFTGPRAVGDGMMYYVYVRSLWKDFDLNFANEYGHYGLLRPDRGDLTTLTPTGMRRSIFSIGPAILWTPFFGAGEAVARAQRLIGIDADLTGYGPVHWNAVALGSLLYGFAAVLLVYAFLRRHFPASIALLSALLMWGATFLHWYMVDQPTYAHAGSVFLAAAALWLWDRDRVERSPWGYFIWGLCLGLAMCVRWQNGVLLLLPGFDLLARLRREPAAWPRLATCGVALGAAALIGAFPQMAAWKVLYGEWLLRYPPHGTGFVRFDHPFLIETFFSSRHGLLSWTPVLWLGFLGFIPACRRRLAFALPLALCLAVMAYVNVCAGDWWAGASFSNRRFDSALPLLAFGMAAAIEWLRQVSERCPTLAVSALLLPLVLWNICEVVLLKAGRLPRGQTVSFEDRVERSAEAVSSTVGSPPTWPASWLFALRHRVAPSKYDQVVGRYLFYRQNNLAGHLDLGDRGDEAMLGEGWGPALVDEGVSYRSITAKARLFAPLDVPETLVIRVRARCVAAPCALTVGVNGARAGKLALDDSWGTQEMKVPRAFWQRETNEVTFETNGRSTAIDAVDFREEPTL
jgi:hypothetical protein